MNFEEAKTLRNELETMLGEKFFFRIHETLGKYWIAISDGISCIATFRSREEFEKLVELSRYIVDSF